MSLEIEGVDDDLWMVGKVYVLHTPGIYVTYPWRVLTPHGVIPKKTKEEAFGAAVAEALNT